MIAGTRQKTVGGTNYKSDRLYPFAKAFTEAAQNIFTTENYDIFTEPTRALRNSAVLEAMKSFFTEDAEDLSADSNWPGYALEQIQEQGRS